MSYYFTRGTCPVSHPCEQDCRFNNNTYICQCTNGYVLAADGISCIRCAKASKQSNAVKPTWHVALCNASNNDTLCSGTAISDQWVLTSAGCACSNGTGIEGLSVRFGKNRTCSYKDTNEFQFSVSEIHCYPAYDPSILTVDIAAVKLHSPISVDVIKNSQPLCIDSVRQGKKLFFANRHVEIFGWGRVGETVESEVTLKSTGNITVHAVLECKNAFKEERVKYRASGGIMCTIANTTSACTGNYGSAVIARKKRRLYFGGIVSKKTSNCGVANSYLAHSKLYTKAAYDWVSSIVQP